MSIGTDATMRVWDLATAKETQRFAITDGNLAVSADGKKVAGSADNKIQIWDLESGKRLAKLAEDGRDLVFSGDGSRLVSMGQGRTVSYWDSRTGRLLGQLKPGEYEFGAGAPMAAPDGRLYAYLSVCAKHARYSLREVATGRQVCQIDGWGEKFTVSPDGKTLATAQDAIAFRELATGGVLKARLPWQRGQVSALAFSPDGMALATGGTNGTILLWDWQAAVALCQRPQQLVEDLNPLWDDLASDDAGKAYQTIGKLSAGNEATVAFLKDRLQPATEKDLESLRRLVGDLDSRQFAAREKAAQELLQRGADAVPALHQVLSAGPSLELKRRIESLLDKPEMRTWSTGTIRDIRAIQVLEQLATLEARRLLQSVAQGVPDSRRTQEARATLTRLGMMEK